MRARAGVCRRYEQHQLPVLVVVCHWEGHPCATWGEDECFSPAGQNTEGRPCRCHTGFGTALNQNQNYRLDPLRGANPARRQRAAMPMPPEHHVGPQAVPQAPHGIVAAEVHHLDQMVQQAPPPHIRPVGPRTPIPRPQAEGAFDFLALPHAQRMARIQEMRQFAAELDAPRLTPHELQRLRNWFLAPAVMDHLASPSVNSRGHGSDQARAFAQARQEVLDHRTPDRRAMRAIQRQLRSALESVSGSRSPAREGLRSYVASPDRYGHEGASTQFSHT